MNPAFHTAASGKDNLLRKYQEDGGVGSHVTICGMALYLTSNGLAIPAFNTLDYMFKAGCRIIYCDSSILPNILKVTPKPPILTTNLIWISTRAAIVSAQNYATDGWFGVEEFSPELADLANPANADQYNYLLRTINASWNEWYVKGTTDIPPGDLSNVGIMMYNAYVYTLENMWIEFSDPGDPMFESESIFFLTLVSTWFFL